MWLTLEPAEFHDISTDAVKAAVRYEGQWRLAA
jgi:hypothetical protein